ncbi:MAG TPA: SapC family protein [Methylibium sp.]|uniref:SapC family protein n=1 Tax=Methylibium sp. TaxID=2067992 RepID=UPI002DBBFDC0|nr:SapC family protein [Methylibium sp.]HEU4458199.1 SapC family protein [Methylibium sp.]
MSQANDLYLDPVALDRHAHRGKRLDRERLAPRFAKLHACFVAASEFPEASKEYVIGFVETRSPAAPPDAPLEVSPIALLGLRENENLFLPPDGAGRWDARYVPAFIRRYPFAYARDAQGQAAVLVDAGYEGLNDARGELLVQDDGEATPYLKDTIGFLDAFEAEVERTRGLCRRLVELGLLKSVQIDVKLADGRALNAGGLQVIDETRLKALSDATLLELARNGALGLLHAHLMSTTNVQHLTERLGARLGPA